MTPSQSKMRPESPAGNVLSRREANVVTEDCIMPAPTHRLLYKESRVAVCQAMACFPDQLPHRLFAIGHGIAFRHMPAFR